MGDSWARLWLDMRAMSTTSGTLTFSWDPARAGAERSPRGETDHSRILVSLLLIAVVGVMLLDTYSLLIALR